jgi:Protein of unknown function (DUF3987)
MLDWIEDYVNYTSSQESPTIFHRWAAITAIAGVVSRNVLLRRRNKYGVEFFRTWPGQVSVVLVAGAGRCKKSTAANLISDILRESGAANLYDGKITPEQLLHKMAGLTVPYLIIVAEELSAFLTKTSYNDGLVDILNKLIDGSNNPYETRRYSGPKAIKLTNPSLTMLSATTPSNLAKAILPQAIGHGYSSRQIYVYSEDPGGVEPMAYATSPDPQIIKHYEDLKKSLVIRLKGFANLRGEFHWTQRAADWYQNWYADFKASPASFGEGWPQRIPDHVIRVALCLSIARGNSSLALEETDLSDALTLVENVNSTMPLVFAHVGQHINSERQNKLLQVFRDNMVKTGLQTSMVDLPEIYTRTIKYYPSKKDLTDDLSFLTMAGILGVVTNPKGGQSYVFLKEP